MGNVKKKLPSGQELEVQIADFEKAHALLQASRIISMPADNLIDLLLMPPVQEALWPCMGVCLYGGQKIKRVGTFDDEKSRGDYLLVLKEVFTANVSPFLVGLASELKVEPVSPVSSDQK